MTVRELWEVTTCDIYLVRAGRETLKLPSGGRLQIEHGALRVRTILTKKFSTEATPHLEVVAEEAEK